MLHEIFEHAGGSFLNIHITPMDPAVIRLESRVEQEVASSSDGSAAGTLGLKGVPIGDFVAELDSEILLDDGDAAERAAKLRVGLVLDAVELLGEDGEGVVGAVGDKEGDINQLVRVGKLHKELKVLVKVPGGIAKWRQDEHLLLPLLGRLGRLDIVQVVDVPVGRIDLDRGMVIEEDGGRLILMPCVVFVLCNVERRL